MYEKFLALQMLQRLELGQIVLIGTDVIQWKRPKKKQIHWEIRLRVRAAWTTRSNVKCKTMDCGRHGCRAMTTSSEGHCRQNMFFLCIINKYINCTLCNFFRHTYIKYLINIFYNYKIETDSLHKLNPI